ncbi:hypothetical protein LTR29_017147 [Friedmanniomyces endolithicus]|nr:hypothetical protein LTR01_001801 [Friedmanniomyces endolithicus]KAK0830335.1 hypothetical protein LTR73_003613 [Friedmanniomyces endolithicus]KAK0929238.1 hypothetical protein LTR29_017147 [Friedmanniomyces endolithicus]
MLALLGLGLGFATISAEEIPRGIMPKRQVVATGATTTSVIDSTSSTIIVSTSSSTVSPSTTSTTSPTSTVPISTTSTQPISTSAPISTSTPSDTPIAPVTTSPTSSDSTTSAGPSSTVPPSSTATISSAFTISDSSPAAAAGGVSTSSDVSSISPSSTELPTTIAVTTTNAAGSTITSSILTSTLAPASSTPKQSASNPGGVVRTLTGTASNLVVIGSSTINRSTLSSATTITSALLAEETLPSTYTSYWTSDGSVYSSLVTTDRIVTSTTGFATATLTPALQNGGGSGSNLSTSSKSIVGGVVGGIGGAVLIGGIAVVAWRLWGRKRRVDSGEDGRDEMLDSRDDSIRREKIGLQQGRYGNPGGPVTASSNF